MDQDNPNAKMVSPTLPVQIINKGDCVTERAYLVRADIFPKYQKCCEKKDQLELSPIFEKNKEGLITDSLYKDALIWIAVGVVLSNNTDKLSGVFGARP